MPMIRHLYPKDWELRSKRVRNAANWHCEGCYKPCLLAKEDWLDFLFRLGCTVGQAIAHTDDAWHPTRFVLTTAHPNHDPENDDAELRAWCAPCHCRYDLAQTQRKRQLRLERQGQGNLFDLATPILAGHGKELNRVQLPIRGVTLNET